MYKQLAAQQWDRFRLALAARLQGAAELPNGLKKLLSVAVFLTVTAFSVSGGILVTAALMNAVVTRLDMPSTSMASVYSLGAGTIGRSSGQPVVRIIHGERVIYEPVYIVPRPTVGSTLDRAIVHTEDPGSPYIQADAVGIGQLLQRQVHGWLQGVLGQATRTAMPSVVAPSTGISIANGQ